MAIDMQVLSKPDRVGAISAIPRTITELRVGASLIVWVGPTLRVGTIPHPTHGST